MLLIALMYVKEGSQFSQQTIPQALCNCCGFTQTRHRDYITGNKTENMLVISLLLFGWNQLRFPPQNPSQMKKIYLLLNPKIHLRNLLRLSLINLLYENGSFKCWDDKLTMCLLTMSQTTRLLPYVSFW